MSTDEYKLKKWWYSHCDFFFFAPDVFQQIFRFRLSFVSFSVQLILYCLYNVQVRVLSAFITLQIRFLRLSSALELVVTLRTKTVADRVLSGRISMMRDAVPGPCLTSGLSKKEFWETSHQIFQIFLVFHTCLCLSTSSEYQILTITIVSFWMEWWDWNVVSYISFRWVKLIQDDHVLHNTTTTKQEYKQSNVAQIINNRLLTCLE